jgi:anti-anti-sigma factor
VFNVEENSDGRAYRLSGELDLATADDLIKQLEPAVGHSGDIRLDVADLEFIDSCGIRALIVLCKELVGRGRLLLQSPQGEVAKVLELIRADSFPNLVVLDEEVPPWRAIDHSDGHDPSIPPPVSDASPPESQER